VTSWVVGIMAAVSGAVSDAAEQEAERPYELVRAKRTLDDYPPFVGFEELRGWTVGTEDSQARVAFTRSRKRLLWGRYMGELAYHGRLNTEITIRPAKPIPITQEFDALRLWVLQDTDHNRHGAIMLELYVLLTTPMGEALRLPCGNRIGWRKLYLQQHKLQPHELAAVRGGAAFAGIIIRANGEGEQASTVRVYLDNLAFYKATLRPLEFVPRPKPGIDLAPGQSNGLNTGPGRLPFPTRPETILPDNLTENFRLRLSKVGEESVFAYEGEDGVLAYRYRPQTGTLGDITATWGQAGRGFQPLFEGGVRLTHDAQSARSQLSLIDCRTAEDAVVSRWKLVHAQGAAIVTYTMRLWQKSLVIDTQCPGGIVGEFVIGKVKGLRGPRLVHLPYLVGAKGRFPDKRPAVVVAQDTSGPLFVMPMMDYYRSNGSELTFENHLDAETSVAVANGGTRYLPKTDGRRNDCFERLFLTVSPRFEEVLPNIPNPKSPWLSVAAERVFTPLSHATYDETYRYWLNMSRYGMTQIVTWGSAAAWHDDRLTGSGTLRTEVAPGRGGDDALRWHIERMRRLGIMYGVYNCYTDIWPVSRFWDEDYVMRNSNGSWKRTFMPAYTLKYGPAAELESRLAQRLREKFGLRTSYCDVITANPLWEYTDYDSRVPGAGRFISALYAHGELLLHQRKTWNGPSISEGRNHYYYSGIVDANYGQDKYYFCFKDRPWLVDFDLRKMHPLVCNFGMGFPRMGYFYLDRDAKDLTSRDPAVRDPKLDKFIAATIAFGHAGQLVRFGGLENSIRSYFMLQQLARRYVQETVAHIRYADRQGNLHDTSQAVATGVYRRSQVWTRYSNGLEVWVNGNRRETWQIEHARVPPYGFFARSPDRRLVVFSALTQGRRADYVESPAYTYVDGRGRLARFATGASDGIMIALKQADGAVKVIPVRASRFGVASPSRHLEAVALSKEGRGIGQAGTHPEDGMWFIRPVDGAFCYVLTPVR